MDNLLEVRNLHKSYPGFELQGIDLEVPAGEIVGLIGENGAGKTTTIRSILNIVSIDSGEIRVFGIDHRCNEKEIKEKTGVVLDDSFFNGSLTPTDINRILKNIYENWDETYFFQLCDTLKLQHTKRLSKYSSGMKVKLKIATALSHKPELLVLDEPTSGLDPIARNEVLEILKDFVKDSQHSVLFSSHITTDLEHIADKVAFIHEGKMVFQKPMKELMCNGSLEDVMLNHMKGGKL